MHAQELDVNLIVVADCASFEPSQLDAFDGRLDQTLQSQVEELIHVVSNFVSSVYVCQSPKELPKAIHQSRNPLVLPYWFGDGSRSTTCIVPAICEAHEIPYVGPDAFARAVCTDKPLSKVLVKEHGFAAPEGVVLRDHQDFHSLGTVQYPAVVKPSQRDSSVGISALSLVQTATAAENQANVLLNNRLGPVMVESFVPGVDLSLVLLGTSRQIHRTAAGVRLVNGDRDFLSQRLFDAELKKIGDHTMSMHCAEELVAQNDWNNAYRLFQTLSKVELLRIDCRVNDGQLWVLELTPGGYLGPKSDFFGTLASCGLDYATALRLVLTNSLNGHRDRLSNS